jgi:hypothetical protein
MSHGVIPPVGVARKDKLLASIRKTGIAVYATAARMCIERFLAPGGAIVGASVEPVRGSLVKGCARELIVGE